jgi:hypothetical protein
MVDRRQNRRGDPLTTSAAAVRLSAGRIAAYRAGRHLNELVWHAQQAALLPGTLGGDHAQAVTELMSALAADALLAAEEPAVDSVVQVTDRARDTLTWIHSEQLGELWHEWENRLRDDEFAEDELRIEAHDEILFSLRATQDRLRFGLLTAMTEDLREAFRLGELADAGVRRPGVSDHVYERPPASLPTPGPPVFGGGPAMPRRGPFVANRSIEPGQLGPPVGWWERLGAQWFRVFGRQIGLPNSDPRNQSRRSGSGGEESLEALDEMALSEFARGARGQPGGPDAARAQARRRKTAPIDERNRFVVVQYEKGTPLKAIVAAIRKLVQEKQKAWPMVTTEGAISQIVKRWESKHGRKLPRRRDQESVS